ncbi:MAG: hypothetical protein WCW68_03150 [Methanothrix sp.]
MHKFLKVTEHNNCKRGVTVNNRISICILLCLAILASGQAAAQQTYGTKVNAGDPDVGLPLSNFGFGVGAPGANQFFVWISYWDINANGLYDDQDVAYLQFGTVNAAGLRFVRANNIRLTGWGSYPAGSYVKPSDGDMGQPLGPIPGTLPVLPSSVPPQVGFYYMDVSGGAGYDLGDPVYLKALSPPNLPPGAIITAGTNDIRITANAGFPAGSRVSLSDPDAGKALTLFRIVLVNLAGGPTPSGLQFPIAKFAFYNTNGNTNLVGAAIYDEGDVVYFDINPGVAPQNPVVSPNDIRLY